MDEPQLPDSHDPYGDLAPPLGEQGRPSSGRSRRMWAVAAIAVVVLAGGAFIGVKALAGGGSSPTSTAAQGPGGNGRRFGGRGTVGTLQSVDGSTLTVATFGNRDANAGGAGGGTTTVVTNSSTKFAKAVTGALSDVKVGDRVMARGTPDGTDTLTAERITDTGTMQMGGLRRGQGPRNGGTVVNGGPPPNGSVPNGGTRPDPNGIANGTVKSIQGSAVTVAQDDGTTKTVNTTASTVVSVLKSISIQELTTGQPVVVQGTTNGDGTVTATNVEQGLAGFGGGRGGRQDGGTPTQ